MTNDRNFILKDCDVSIVDFFKIDPMLGVVFYYFVKYAKENNLPVVVTSMIDSPEISKRLNRVSTTHDDGRAIDISAKDWPLLHCHRVTTKINDKYARDYGTCPPNGKPRVVVFHNSGHGDHFHLQVKRNIIEFLD